MPNCLCSAGYYDDGSSDDCVLRSEYDKCSVIVNEFSIVSVISPTE